jgi:hypothetical protein
MKDTFSSFTRPCFNLAEQTPPAPPGLGAGFAKASSHFKMGFQQFEMTKTNTWTTQATSVDLLGMKILND